MQQHEGALVGHVQIARERQRRLALDLIAEDRNGREIAAQRQLVAGEQRPGRNGEILVASPAAETGRTLQAAAVVGVNAAAMRANRLAVRIGQRIRRKAISASASFIVKTGARERVLAARERRKCWAICLPIVYESYHI